MRRNQNFGREGDLHLYVLKLFDFLFFPLSFHSLSIFFAAVIDLLLGLLAVKNVTFKNESSRWPIFTMEQLGVA